MYARFQFRLIDKLVIGISTLASAAGVVVGKFFSDRIKEASPFGSRTDVGDVIR